MPAGSEPSAETTNVRFFRGDHEVFKRLKLRLAMLLDAPDLEHPDIVGPIVRMVSAMGDDALRAMMDAPEAVGRSIGGLGEERDTGSPPQADRLPRPMPSRRAS